MTRPDAFGNLSTAGILCQLEFVVDPEGWRMGAQSKSMILKGCAWRSPTIQKLVRIPKV